MKNSLQKEYEIIKKQDGITLIALVVTIVVLLILAGITINMLFSENGIITKAKDAAEKTAKAEQEEAEGMNGVVSQIDNLVSNSKAISLSIAGTKVTTVPIPDGFSYLEGTIDTGYVIKNNTDGNEFVWIPVDKDQKITLKVNLDKDITEIKLIDPYGDEILNIADADVKTTYSNTEIEPTINGLYRVKVKTAEGTETEQLKVTSLYAIDAMNDWRISDEFAKTMGFNNIEEVIEAIGEQIGISNVDEYLVALGTLYKDYKQLENYKERVNEEGGFYIGRYEAGAITVRTVGNADDTVEEIIKANGLPVVKENQTPYNHVTYNQAVGLAQNMYTEKSYISNLSTGAAWDRVLGWVYETKQKTMLQIAGDSKEWGNYKDSEFSITKGSYSEDDGETYTPVSGTYTKAEEDDAVLLTTGATEKNAVNNIFDLAGNVEEWNLELLGGFRSIRGGSYFSNGSTSPASHRNDFYPEADDGNLTVGFRPALYL